MCLNLLDWQWQKLKNHIHLVEVVEVFSDKFASWQFGQLDFIDPIALYKIVRSVFPLFTTLNWLVSKRQS